MTLQGLEGGVTDDVLHAAGVLGSAGLVHTQAAEKVREDRVALVDLFGYLAPGGGEGDVAAVVYCPAFSRPTARLTLGLE